MTRLDHQALGSHTHGKANHFSDLNGFLLVNAVWGLPQFGESSVFHLKTRHEKFVFNSPEISIQTNS